MKSSPLIMLVRSMQAGIACGERDAAGVLQLRLNNLQVGGTIELENHIRIPARLVPDDMCLEPGDVLFNNTNSVELIGKTAYFAGGNEKTTFSNHITRIRVREGILDAEFLALWLQHQWRSKLFEGMCDRWIGQAAVQRRKLEMLEVPTLPIVEQRRIASRLKAQLAEVEHARQAAEAQVQDSTLLRRRFLNEVFAALDTVPSKVLGEYATTTSGSTPSRSDKRYWQPAEIPWVKTAEVAFAPITLTEEAISKTALAECSLTLLPSQTVLVAMYGQGKTRGQSAVLEIPAVTNQACFAILPNETWEPEFLYYWLMASYQNLRDLSEDRGGNQANLNGALLKALEVPAPDRSKQRQVVARIKAALAEIDAIEAAGGRVLADLRQLPARLLAHAFEVPGD